MIGVKKRRKVLGEGLGAIIDKDPPVWPELWILAPELCLTFQSSKYIVHSIFFFFKEPGSEAGPH
jgi:hypothetical protein